MLSIWFLVLWIHWFFPLKENIIIIKLINNLEHNYKLFSLHFLNQKIKGKTLLHAERSREASFVQVFTYYLQHVTFDIKINRVSLKSIRVVITILFSNAFEDIAWKQKCYSHTDWQTDGRTDEQIKVNILHFQ